MLGVLGWVVLYFLVDIDILNQGQMDLMLRYAVMPLTGIGLTHKVVKALSTSAHGPV